VALGNHSNYGLQNSILCPPANGLDFRGLTAPASLKQPYGDHLLFPVFGFPGLNRPGLIEAGLLVHAWTSNHGFPGLNRPGLIEAARPRCFPSWRPRFPVLNRPGLIEAKYTGSQITNRRSISGA